MAMKIRTTHVGSLPRPPEIVPLLLEREAGGSTEATEAAIAAAVDDTVKRQLAVGLDVVNDGEMGKLSYAHYVYHRLDGVTRKPHRWTPPTRGPLADDYRRYPVWGARFAAEEVQLDTWLYECVAPLTVKDVEPLRADLRRLRAAADATGAEAVFMNAASPGVVPYFIINRHYPTHEAYIEALAEALRPEYEAIVEAGFILQIDCPDLGVHDVPDLDDAGRDARKAFCVEAINAATAGIDPQRMRMHLCWGNWAGPHDCDLPLAAVMPLALKARPAAISFEAANPRHEHEWTWFDENRFPDDRVAIPGVIDNTTPFVEHPELVAQRIGRYVQKLGVDRVIAGVDCGFATHALTVYDSDLAFAKLRSLVEGAALATAAALSSAVPRLPQPVPHALP